MKCLLCARIILGTRHIVSEPTGQGLGSRGAHLLVVGEKQ